jgi:hypothetical protein
MSLETVEFAEEKTIFVGISNQMVYEKVSRIQVTDPGASVTDWYSQILWPGLGGSMLIVFNVASILTNSLNSICVGDTLKVTIT